jgi:hypothetical protein
MPGMPLVAACAAAGPGAINVLAITHAMSEVVAIIRFSGHSLLIRLAVLLTAIQRAPGSDGNNLPT